MGGVSGARQLSEGEMAYQPIDENAVSVRYPGTSARARGTRASVSRSSVQTWRTEVFTAWFLVERYAEAQMQARQASTPTAKSLEVLGSQT